MAPQVRLGFSNASVSTSISVSFTGSAKKVNLSIGNLELKPPSRTENSLGRELDIVSGGQEEVGSFVSIPILILSFFPS